MPDTSPDFGIVALAAYRPPEHLFARQLLSIQAQTYRDFRCLISVDGDSLTVAEAVRRICGGDERFAVIGFDDRLGFYGNFERVLEAVPDEAQWIALSDQDDYWYPGKLATLVPELSNHALVSGQARVVDEAGQVLVPRTKRRTVDPVDLFSENQVTGSLSVVRAELLSIALPFPRLHTPAQYHDHWIGVCAAAAGGFTVVDEIVQDYIQHDANVVGENRTGVRQLIGRVQHLGRTYEGTASPAALTRFLASAGIGWRALMAETLQARHPTSSATVGEALRSYHPGARRGTTARAIVRGLLHRTVPPRRAVELLVSLGASILVDGVRKARL
ncbi:glycosyltransferase [Arthrobacter sp. MDT2-16]